MPTVAAARWAMNTRFEIVLHGGDPVALRAAADEALNEIEALEAQLSVFRPTSEIARVNKHAATQPVRVSPPVFRLLQRVQVLSAETGGAFDPTVGPLLAAWGFLGGPGAVANPAAVADARDRVGMHRVALDPFRFEVRFMQPGMLIDLGAVGKGYAIDCATDLLREAGVTSGFLHGGTSSCFAIGRPPAAEAWRTSITDPRPPGIEGTTDLGVVTLREESLGVSCIWGKSFTNPGGQSYGHVIDPRSGEPVDRAWLAAVVLPSATESDALSTALITLGSEGLELIRRLRPASRMLVVEASSATGPGPIHRLGLDVAG